MSQPTTEVNEVAPDVFRICTYFAEFDLQFSQFLVRDDSPLLFHTGMKGLFPLVRQAVSRILDPATIRWISFSHFEADECGALNEWLEVAPETEPVCSFVGANVNLGDFSSRAPKVLGDDERISTGKYRFRYIATPQVPHAWDAGLLFEETNKTLFCSDLFHQNGNVDAITSEDVVGRFQATLQMYNQSPFANYIPWTRKTREILDGLRALEPRTILPMHGSAFQGDGARAMTDLADMLEREVGPRA